MDRTFPCGGNNRSSNLRGGVFEIERNKKYP